jgi:hypothetical protein
VKKKDISRWAVNYKYQVRGDRVVFSADRDGVEVVHSFPLADRDGTGRLQVKLFREKAARLVLRALEDEKN